MVVLGAVILSLGCMFLGYCLLHFRHELKRSDNRLTSYGLSSDEFRLTARDIEIPGRPIVLQLPQATRIISGRRLIRLERRTPAGHPRSAKGLK